MEEWRDIPTPDIQHDLAMFMADDLADSLAQEMIEVLALRKAQFPANAMWKYNPYARFKRELVYDLVDSRPE